MNTERKMILPEQIARIAHAKHIDKSGAPYIGHTERVVRNLRHRWPDATNDEIAAAWLHDVVEDTTHDAVTLIEAGVSPTAVSIVGEVTRPEGMAYAAGERGISRLDT